MSHGSKTRSSGKSGSYHLNGRGHSMARQGHSRPGHYSQRVGRNIINRCTASTDFVGAGGTCDTASVTNPEGVAQTLVRFTGSGDNTTGFITCTSAGIIGAQLGREGIEFDIYYQTGEPYTDLTRSGVALRCTFINAAGTDSVNANIQIRQGWQRIRLKKADFNSIGGSGNWDTTDFNRLIFRLGNRASVTHTVFIRNLGYMARTRPLVCLQFDDIGESVATTAAPIMAARGLVGSCAVIEDAIGQDAYVGYNRMTASEMLALKRAGWDFVNHTKSHQLGVLPTATQAECETEIQSCRDAIIANGLGNGISEHLFCAPYGEWETNYWAAAAASGCKLFRGTVGDAGNVPPVSESDVMYSPLVQVPVMYVVAATTTAAILSWVDSLIGKGGYGILLYHHVLAASGADIERTTADFTADMDGLLARKDDVDFVNMTDLYEATRL